MRDTSEYQVDGHRVFSVTEGMGLAGVSNLDGIDPRVLAIASARGVRVHAWTEWFDGDESEGPEPDISGIEGYCEAYVEFLAASGFEMIDKEQVVVNSKYYYAGRYDRFGRFNGSNRNAMVDIKAVAAISAGTRLQLAGYSMAKSPTSEINAHDRIVIQLKPSGKYQMRKYDNVQDYYNWLAVVRVAHFRLEHGMAQLEG